MRKATPDTGQGEFGQCFGAVLFDMDGCLVDSGQATYEAWRRWGAEQGLGSRYTFTAHGVPASDVIRALLPAERVPSALARIIEIERSHVANIRALPGASAALDQLAESRVALVTSSSKEVATSRLAAAGLEFPGIIIAAEDVSQGKPDPEPYLHAAHRLGVVPGRCLVVEDAPAGISAARAAGCLTLALLTTHPESELVADYFVRDLSEVAFRVFAGCIEVTLVPRPVTAGPSAG